MKTRVLNVKAQALALHCALWIAFAPVIPQLHQAFASHRHVFCPQHHRIEDAGPKQEYRRPSDSSAADEARVAATRVNADLADIGSRPACIFSNLVVHLASNQPIQCCVPVPTNAREIEMARDVHLPAADVIRLAPKQSPPFSA